MESNLKDVYNINSLYDSLGFNAYAKCNVDPIMSFSNLYLNNINLSFILNRSGLLDNTMNTIFNPTNIPHVTNERFGIGLMTKNPQTTYDMSTSFFFNSLFNELNDLYNSKNQNYNNLIWPRKLFSNFMWIMTNNIISKMKSNGNIKIMDENFKFKIWNIQPWWKHWIFVVCDKIGIGPRGGRG